MSIFCEHCTYVCKEEMWTGGKNRRKENIQEFFVLRENYFVVENVHN
jgi:hypothetical protein